MKAIDHSDLSGKQQLKKNMSNKLRVYRGEPHTSLKTDIRGNQKQLQNS